MIPFCYVCIKPLDLRRICRCLKAGSCHLLDFVSMPQVENSLNNIQKQKPATYENSLSLPPSIFYQMSFMDAQTEFGQCVHAQEKYFSCMHESHTKTSYLEICFYLKGFRTYFCKFAVKQGTYRLNTSYLVKKYWIIFIWTKY